MKELDLGCSDFKNIITNNNYFVDKSLFIKEVIHSQKAVTLLPRPRRFGKTLNLSMLHSFFDVTQTENEKLFTDLKIWQTDDSIREKRGKYPVVFITFKDVKADHWELCYKQIISEIAELYKKHRYLLADDLLDENERSVFNAILSRGADEIDFQRSLRMLCEYLCRYHKQNVVILIDEYDAPIQAGYKNYYEQVIGFMKALMSGAFKDNSFLYKGVITGILRISKESIFSGLNNVSVFSVLDHRFSDQFGFTEAETKQVLDDFNVRTSFDEVKKWYNGYRMGETADLYNPWSILNYVTEFESGFKPYWVNTSSDDLIKDRIREKDANQTRLEFLELINNRTIKKELYEKFAFPDFDTKKELLWTLLVFSGYLTVRSQTGRNSYEIGIPNYEVKTVFQDIIIDWLEVKLKIQKSLLETTANDLVNNELRKFEKGFKKIIGDTFSYFDTDGEPENVYQSYVLGLLAIVGDDYIIKSNRESGEGRYDIMLIPHDRSKNGVVIEIKQISRGKREGQKAFFKRINETIQSALAQIENNQYCKELVENRVQNIIKLPIVFAGKEPYIFPLE